jgi:regulator of replication initiation timing
VSDERLRIYVEGAVRMSAELTRLRADLAQLTAHANATSDEMQRLAAENEALRGLLNRHGVLRLGGQAMCKLCNAYGPDDPLKHAPDCVLRASIEGEPT